MGLLKWEMKKIWQPGLLLAIALIGVVFYQVRTGFYLEYFNTGDSWGAAQVQLAYGWLETYGNAIEPEERPGLDAQLAEMKAEFARQVAQIPGAAEAGITDYASYAAWAEAQQRRLVRRGKCAGLGDLFQYQSGHAGLAGGVYGGV